METDLDLPTLIQNNDHLNVLRYIRVHELRNPETVIYHGKALLGPDLSGGGPFMDDLVRLASLEQICLAALDENDGDLAELCLDRIKSAGGGGIVSKDSARFRRLLARCLEASGDLSGAEIIYDDLLRENPANLLALKRKYCILRAQVGKETAAVEAMNKYLKQNYADTSAWYEMANFRMELGDYKGAAFALEEVVLAVPLDSKIHCELAECYATIGGLDNFMLARKHMAQALELDKTNRRAQFGLVSVANGYLEEAAKTGKKKNFDEHEVEVAKELVKYGTEQVLKSYKGAGMFDEVKALMKEFTDGL